MLSIDPQGGSSTSCSSLCRFLTILGNSSYQSAIAVSIERSAKNTEMNLSQNDYGQNSDDREKRRIRLRRGRWRRRRRRGRIDEGGDGDTDDDSVDGDDGGEDNGGEVDGDEVLGDGNDDNG